ncbi:DUF485 domain-containing protein [Planococcus sp. APC 4015]|nr:DUF485 domain-containing protein [Planococcus sp. APC 4015]
MSDSRTDAAPPGGIDYIAVEQSPRFLELKKRQRSFVFPLAVAFLVWYFAFVLLSSFAPEFMATPVWGLVNVGLLMGLGQFVTTFAITMGYVAYANRTLDPISKEIRDELETREHTA